MQRGYQNMTLMIISSRTNSKRRYKIYIWLSGTARLASATYAVTRTLESLTTLDTN